MPIRFNLLALSRRYSAKFALVSLILSIAILLVTFTVQAWRAKPDNDAKPLVVTISPTPNLQGRPPVGNGFYSRLALQPQADRMRRRLGRRFLGPGREVSVYTGTVNLGADRYTVRLARSQDDDDERLTIALNGGPSALTWSGKDGARADNSPAIGAMRMLAEWLALYSPDQFVLAQLRGANYYTLARSVQPSEAKGAIDYSGPVWDIVRVDEPVNNSQSTGTENPARLYFINTASGLIDKVVSQENGETITAGFSSWVNQGGEFVPTRIIWKKGQQIAMEFTLTNVAHTPKQ